MDIQYSKGKLAILSTYPKPSNFCKNISHKLTN